MFWICCCSIFCVLWIGSGVLVKFVWLVAAAAAQKAAAAAAEAEHAPQEARERIAATAGGARWQRRGDAIEPRWLDEGAQDAGCVLEVALAVDERHVEARAQPAQRVQAREPRPDDDDPLPLLLPRAAPALAAARAAAQPE